MISKSDVNQLALLRNPFYRFIFLFIGLYALWYGLYEFVLKPNGTFDSWVIEFIVNHARSVFGWMGVELEPRSQGFLASNWLAIKGTVGVIVGAPCNGLALFALFIAFMFSFPGPIKHKLWFMPLRVLLIHLVNVLRVIALVSIVAWNEEWLEFNHDYTFTILVYLFVFMLWYIWIRKFSPLSKGAA